ncbi:MAG: CDP-glycerol glycerophosphotransferase family protein, partial [Clostridia bacterium]|nr:CDP-glycerol glycerophosphotransferase family protein [Clostridia bacterium]
MKETLRALIADTVFIPLFYLLRLFPIKKNKVVFSSFFGRGYGDCPARICDRLLSRRVDVDAVWVLSDPSLTLPSGVRSVHLRSLGWVYELATAAVWIDNCRKPPYVRKRRGQKYIQTWHGDVCVKAIEADAADTLSPRYVASAINDSKMADLVVSGCEWRTENIKSSFWYSGEILRAELYPPPR